jgi:hypothetical protein
MPAILRPDEHMQVVTYTGTGAAQTIYCGFKPDLVWIKSRSATTSHKLTDSVRGITKGLISNTDGAETTDVNGLTDFTTTGFTIGSDSNYNTNGATYVAWCWKAGQGVTSTNNEGSIPSTVSVNHTAGFSIIRYTGTGVTGSVGHGILSTVPPKFLIIKRTNTTGNWLCVNDFLTNYNWYLTLNTTNTQTGDASIGNMDPNQTNFGVGTSALVNASGSTYVAYCWTPIEGYSAFGKYTGNGSTDGTFVYTGFRPKFVMLKRTDAAGNWLVIDTSREPYNSENRAVLFPNVTDAETTGATPNDILSNGFKPRNSGVGTNANGGTYIYMAFAENPLKYANAR